jgi:CheY-like chemotaxis protein
MLKQQGYSVILAANGPEAVDIFGEKASEISIVLLDLTMPLISGEETLRRLQSIRRDVKVVLTRGYNEAEAIQRFAGNGLSGFIQKPYTPTQLAEKIKTVLDAHSQT